MTPLEAQKVPTEVFVIDKAENPRKTENGTATFRERRSLRYRTATVWLRQPEPTNAAAGKGSGTRIFRSGTNLRS